MTNHIVLSVEGYEIHAASADAEPTVRDIDLARRAGMKTPRHIRPIVRAALLDGGIRPEEIIVVAAAVDIGKGGKRAVEEFWLTETAAIMVLTRLKTETAIAMTRDMIRVYREAKRMLIAPPKAKEPGQLQARIGDDPAARRRVKALCRTASKVTGIHVSRIQGQIRKPWGVMSIYRIALSSLDHTCAILLDLITAPPPKMLRAPERQRNLFEN